MLDVLLFAHNKSKIFRVVVPAFLYILKQRVKYYRIEQNRTLIMYSSLLFIYRVIILGVILAFIWSEF